MKYRSLHPWNVSLPRAAAIQTSLRARLRLKAPRSLPDFALVAGADVSYQRGGNMLYAAVVVMTWPGLRVVETALASDRARFPYVPGYLSFREVPVLLKAFRRLRVEPDILLCDGQGIAHPRGFGLACHLGMVLDMPSVGCAKSRLIGEHAEPRRERGWAVPLRHQGRTVGAVLRTRDDVSPIFVSPGNRMDLHTAARITLSCCAGKRIPEPTRLAHLEVNRLRRRSTGGLRVAAARGYTARDAASVRRRQRSVAGAEPIRKGAMHGLPPGAEPPAPRSARKGTRARVGGAP